MDLSTTYLGLKLKNPLVPSSSPLTRSLDNLKRMEDAGAAAVVLHSLFEEQINQESHTLDAYLTHPQSQRKPGNAHHRQPQRRLHRGVGSLCP